MTPLVEMTIRTYFVFIIISFNFLTICVVCNIIAFWILFRMKVVTKSSRSFMNCLETTPSDYMTVCTILTIWNWQMCSVLATTEQKQESMVVFLRLVRSILYRSYDEWGSYGIVSTLILFLVTNSSFRTECLMVSFKALQYYFYYYVLLAFKAGEKNHIYSLERSE